MISHDEIKRALFDPDGWCIDINVAEQITKAGSIGIIDFIASSWTLELALGSNGKEFTLADLPNVFDLETATLHTMWKGTGISNYLQAFFIWNTPGQVFCELTFNPKDMNPAQFEITEFLQFLSKLKNAAGSDEYYVRYENASWKHRDAGNTSRVIFSHETFVLPNG